MPPTRGRGGTGSGRGGRSMFDRDALLAAVALQDHMARTMRIPGGPKNLPSTQPGATQTLAQHLGLIPGPPALLTEDDWTEVHLKARIRQDSTSECPICREDFKQDPQVLLSCSHVFHKQCLAAFERHSRTRCCPLCRAVQYQKKVIADGAEAHRQQCASRIQAAVRGWMARKRYKEMRKHCPPQDPRLKREWAAEQLGDRTDRLIEGMQTERGDIDALFAEMDAALAISRAAGDAMNGPAARRLQERMRMEALQAAESLPGSGRHAATDAGAAGSSLMYGESSELGLEASQHEHDGRPSRSNTAAGAAGAARSSMGGDVDWGRVVARAKARNETICPICIGPLKRRGDAGIAWLSCTHQFHLDCICAFEAYEISAGGMPSCPVCRSAYQRRCFA